MNWGIRDRLDEVRDRVGECLDRASALQWVGAAVAGQVEIDHLASAFLAGFTSARPAPSYLMRDVDVTWTKVRAPWLAPTEALT